MNRIIKILFIAFSVLFLSKHSFAQPIPDYVVQQIATYLEGETGATFSFYLRRVNSNIDYENINDPYNTFGNSIIFAASAKEEEDTNPFGLVGIYDDGKVVWYSERIKYPNHFTTGGISRVGELNRDGKAEIITTWTQHYDGIFGPSYGWVFSWDENTGKRINEIDEDGYSTLISHETGSFSLTDLNGDGIWEIYSSIPETDIPIQSYEYHYYMWNGTIYEELLTAPSEEELKFVPKNRLEAKV